MFAAHLCIDSLARRADAHAANRLLLLLLLLLVGGADAADDPAPDACTGPPLQTTARLCPFAQRTLIALKAKGCDHTHHELNEHDLYEKPEWFLDLNPVGFGGGVGVGWGRRCGDWGSGLLASGLRCFGVQA
jgi:hypothetical protein